MTDTAAIRTAEDRIAATVTQRADGRWAWEVLVDGERFTWIEFAPEMPAYRCSAFGDCRRERSAQRKARKYARKAADRIRGAEGRELVDATRTLVDWK